MILNKEHIKILVADDEALARKRILALLNETSYAMTVSEASSGKETLSMIIEEQPDLVFLDIKMTDITGFDVLRQLPKNHIPIIIFVTAFDKFAVKAFEVQAIDFLLKPYKRDRFYDALQRALEQLAQLENKQFHQKIDRLLAYVNDTTTDYLKENNEYLTKVVLKLNKKYIFIEVANIDYIKAAGYYAEIFTRDQKKYVYRISMIDFIKKLDPKSFSRINRSVIINHNSVKEVISEGLGDFSVLLHAKKAFSVSKNYKHNFFSQMGIK